MADFSTLKPLITESGKPDTSVGEKGMQKYEGAKSITLNESAREFVAFAEKHPGAFASMSVRDIREAVGADAFDSITLDAMHKGLLKGYQSWEPQWPKLISDRRSVRDFRTQYAIIHSGFDRLPEVLKGGAYLEQDAFADDQITYTPKKYGSLFGYTFEAQTYDDLGLLNTAVTKLGAAAARTLEYFFFYTCLDANPTSYNGAQAFFTTGTFYNVDATTGLSYTRLAYKYHLMLKQTALGSDATFTNAGYEPSVFIPKYLIVHPVQALNAKKILGSVNDPDNANNTINPLYGQLEIIVTPYITSTNYYLMADPAQANTMAAGLWNGSPEPELFYEAANSGHAFEYDEVRMKIRTIFGGCALDPRAFVIGTCS